MEAIREISSRVLAERAVDALQYSTTEGYAPLRSRLKTYMKEKSTGQAAILTSC